MKCLFCKKRISPEIIVDNLLSDYKKKDKTQYRYIKCPKCSMVLIDPLPGQQKLKKEVYNKSYFNWQKISFYQRIIYSFYLYKDYKTWINSDYKNKGKLLDLGCGEGDFMFQIKRDGWDVYGTELNPFLVKNLKKTFGTDKVFFPNEERLSIRHKAYFDVITLWHVLEHLNEPLNLLKKNKKLLKKNGKIFIEVPNADSYVFHLFGRNYTWLRIPDHLFYYSPSTLRYILKKSGFREIKLFYPMKANLNFSLNLEENYLRRFPNFIKKIIFLISVPFSIIISFIGTITGKTEVLRAEASV